MKLHINLISIIAVLASIMLLNVCDKPKPSDKSNISSIIQNEAKKTAPSRLKVNTEKEVTFYPTYGYREEGGWNIHLRGWVHKNREHLNKFVTRLASVKDKCNGLEMNNFQSRSDDFEDDDKALETVIIKFDSDPDDKPYQFKKSRSDGIVQQGLVLTEQKAKELLEKQNSTNGWLTFRAVSKEHTGLGRIRLIEPEGVSLISDIDDTIKVTDVPAGRDIVLRNTFCLDFKSAPDMAKMYADLGDVSVHYISGGPEQLFGPLYDFLITGPGGFPEGTFHLKFFPKNLLSGETSRNLKRFVDSSLDVTYTHKIKEITSLMERFPQRQFILVGDSGEIDPEVYSEIKRKRPNQVKEIWIRDVINDAGSDANPYRLEGMRIIKVDPTVCVGADHFKNLSLKMNQVYAGRSYKRNTAPPCDK